MCIASHWQWEESRTGLSEHHQDRGIETTAVHNLEVGGLVALGRDFARARNYYMTHSHGLASRRQTLEHSKTASNSD